eukprot:2260981-Prymnesium_polylepis.1
MVPPNVSGHTCSHTHQRFPPLRWGAHANYTTSPMSNNTFPPIAVAQAAPPRGPRMTHVQLAQWQAKRPKTT